MKRAFMGFLILLLVTPGLLVLTAGTAAWPMAWAYAAVAVVGSGGAHLLMARRHPDTLRERAKGLRAEGTAPWDRWLVPVVVWGPVVALLVAGLDHRFGWSRLAPAPLQLAALAAAAAGYGLAGWAMVENRFFVATARIQASRGHTVVASGPYRRVRHPGYAGALLATAAIPFILDSAWALIPTAITVTALVIRTGREDGMLRAGLAGYPEYAAVTRYRLVPGVW